MNLQEFETIKHGSSDFPIALYKVTPDFPRYRMMCHWHVEYELIRVISGTLQLRIDESDFTLAGGDSILIHGGTLHSGEPDNCIYECSVFSIAPLTQLVGCKEQLAPILPSDTKISRVYSSEEREISQTINDYFEALENTRKGYKLTAIACLYRIFSIIIENEMFSYSKTEKNAIEGRYLKRFKNVLTWLEDHYKEDITLDALADIAGFSPKYFCRLFSKMTGRSPIDYLNCYRIDRASEMLLCTEKPIIDIAADCGFYDLSYFVKVFKKYKNVPPGQYRKLLEE